MSFIREVFQYKETRCTILSDNEKAIKLAVSSIQHHRRRLEEYVHNNPNFLFSLKPVAVREGPAIARLMAEAAEKACVGPMAAVAGVIADLAVEEMKSEECDVAIVENGGEVSAFSSEPVDIALLAGDTVLSGTFGFRLRDFPMGVATSSGIFSHAFSFGEADSVTVFSKSAGLADACATAVANVVRGRIPRRSICKALRRGMSIPLVEGVLILYKGLVGCTGKIPEIIKLSADTKTTPYLMALKNLQSKAENAYVTSTLL